MKTSSALRRLIAMLTLAALLVGPLAATTSAAEKSKPEGSHTDTSFTLSTGSMTQGDPVVLTLTAVVTVSGGTAATGTVRFAIGGTNIAFIDITTVSGTQTASTTYDASGLPAGDHTFHAHYIGQGSFNASNANAQLAVAVKPAPPAPPSDNTAPVITPTGVGVLTTNDWYTSDVSISWSVTDAESPIVSRSGCDTVTIATDTAGTPLKCTATSTGGTSSSTRTIKRDATAPSIEASASASAPANALGWNNTAVTIAFACDDATSGIARCADGVTLSTDGAGQVVTGSATDSAGNTASASLTVNIDTTAPTITASASPAANDRGWHKTNVTVAFSCADATSGVAACAQPVTLSTEGAAQVVTGSATDSAGNGASARLTVNLDKTAPTIAFVGATAYTVDQLVSITCSSSDALSGVASSTCSAASGDAYALFFGTKTVTASATDKADNTFTASTNFTVSVTADSLCNLTKRFASKLLGNSLCAQLSAAAAAGARGDAKAKANALGAYAREVNAQTGKAFTAEKAAILVRLAGQL